MEIIRVLLGLRNAEQLVVVPPFRLILAPQRDSRYQTFDGAYRRMERDGMVRTRS